MKLLNMSSTSFVCIFCSDKFESKKSLAEHFRTHAKGSNENVSYSKYGKVNNRTSSKGKVTIKCDVCTEEFCSTTDAISHKYKKHRDAPIKHFCPSCGKQFPIKHIWELHQETHAHEDKPTETIACDICNAGFYNTKARIYHQKSFHRTVYSLEAIDTPPPSKKISVNSQGDVLSAYYCNFCGSEYVIKYNLQKHIHDHHFNEQGNCPTDVIKCKICDALFYNEKAYNFHTSYHKTNDLYVTSEEMRQHIVTKIDQDFDFRRVKSYTRVPSKKKIKTMMDQVGKKYFQIGDMSTFSPPPSDDESDEDGSGVNKTVNKQKEETVSGSSEAITLDEFVNMNKDIFSDCFDTKLDSHDVKLKEETSPKNGNDTDIKIKSDKEETVTSELTVDGLLTTLSDCKNDSEITCTSKAMEIDSKQITTLPKILKKTSTKEILVKKITVPPGAAMPGLKIITGAELKKMKQQGFILSVVPKPPAVLNNIMKQGKVMKKILLKVQPGKPPVADSVGEILKSGISDIGVSRKCDSLLNKAERIENVNANTPVQDSVKSTDVSKCVSLLDELQNKVKPVVNALNDNNYSMEDRSIRLKCLTSKAFVVVERCKTIPQLTPLSANSVNNKKPALKSNKVYTRRVNCARSAKSFK